MLKASFLFNTGFFSIASDVKQFDYNLDTHTHARREKQEKKKKGGLVYRFISFAQQFSIPTA
jgi:hypothetical protein